MKLQKSILQISILVLCLPILSGCLASSNSPFNTNRHPNDPYYDPYYNNTRYPNDYEFHRNRRERDRIERERLRLEQERLRLEQERLKHQTRPASRPAHKVPQQRPIVPQRPAPAQCPSGFTPSERKCTKKERKRGCQDMRTSQGLGCVRNGFR